MDQTDNTIDWEASSRGFLFTQKNNLCLCLASMWKSFQCRLFLRSDMETFAFRSYSILCCILSLGDFVKGAFKILMSASSHERFWTVCLEDNTYSYAQIYCLYTLLSDINYLAMLDNLMIQWLIKSTFNYFPFNVFDCQLSVWMS